MARRLWVVAPFLIVLAGCGERQVATLALKPPSVHVAKPTEKKVTDYEYFTGRTDAIDSVDVRARVTGYLTEVKFKPGQPVKAKDVLFKIDPRPYKAELDRVDGQVLLAEARLKLAVADYNRARDIARTPGAISQQEIDKYAAAQMEADASLKAAKANSESARLNLEFTDVVAPVDGIVGRNLLTVGNLVNQDTTLLTTIVSEDPMYVYFDINERVMLKIQQLIRDGKVPSAKRGDKYPIEYGLATEGDQYPHEGTIDFVNNQVDPGTGTLQIRGVFPNPAPPNRAPRLLTPGLFVRVRIPVGDPHQELVLPQAAIGTDQGKKYVMVVNDQNVVEYRPITAGSQQPGGLQVVRPVQIVREGNGIRLANPGEEGMASLTASDSVIVSGIQRVRPGMTVEAQPASPAQ